MRATARGIRQGGISVPRLSSRSPWSRRKESRVQRTAHTGPDGVRSAHLTRKGCQGGAAYNSESLKPQEAKRVLSANVPKQHQATKREKEKIKVVVRIRHAKRMLENEFIRSEGKRGKNSTGQWGTSTQTREGWEPHQKEEGKERKKGGLAGLLWPVSDAMAW